MKILVTGGAGFIGTNYIRYVLGERADVEVVNLDKLTYAGNLANLADLESDPRYTFVEGDICDKVLVDRLVQDVDLIVHFAAESHVDRSIEGPDIFLQTNIIGTQLLLDAARMHGNKRFHHVSTDEVFGSLGHNDPKFCETTPYDPRSPYSASKAASDHIVRAYYHTYGLPITISNCSNNYGPYQYPEKLIPLFVTNLIDSHNVPIYGTGENVRDWIHVDDHVRGVHAVIEKGKIGETYCLGGDAEKRNIDIAHLLLDAFGKDESAIEHVADRKGHDLRYAIDFTKARTELGWEPAHDFASGLQETIDWYKTHEDWWRPLKSAHQNKTA
jgi:dTDP-glucose 4,6-dehydratase